MKLSFYFSVFFLLLGGGLYAQQAPIMLCNPAGTDCTPYYNCDSAIANAQAGDYIYLPGGNFSIYDTLDKKLHFIGAGISPDSTTTTGITSISTVLNVNSSASNSTFEGIYFTQNVTNQSGELNNVTFKRCRGASLNCAVNANINSALIIQSIFQRLTFGHTSNTTVDKRGKNNIIQNSIVYQTSDLENSTILNCVYAKRSYGGNNYYCLFVQSALHNIHGTLVKNSILYGGIYTYDSYSVSANSFSHCVVNQSRLYSCNNAGIASMDNIFFSQGDTSTFVSASFTGDFDWSEDYHVNPNSPAHNGGDDGKDMGIYGGNTPWVEGAVPTNPHIYFKDISGATNASGDLPVEIKIRTGN